MDRQALAAEYEKRTDDELLRLALVPDDLTTEAQEQLQVELSKRGLSAHQKLADFRKREDARKEALDLDVRLFSVRGIGRGRYGKADRVIDTATGTSTFRTTVFLVFLYTPLFPTGSYVVEQRADRSHLVFLKKLPLDWEQVLKAWVASAAIWLGIILCFKFALPLLLR